MTCGPTRATIAMVFQSYALYPHLSVVDNIADAAAPAPSHPVAALSGRPPSPCGTRRIESEIADAAGKWPRPCGSRNCSAASRGSSPAARSSAWRSGRAMVRAPRVFLMDEPLSNLDAELRVHMRAEIAQLHRRLGATFIYVTHDQAEAMTMSDRVVVMMEGMPLQVAPPKMHLR